MEERINKAAREHEESVEGWLFSDASTVLYRFFDLINDRFFDGKLSTPVLSFKRPRGTQRGHYVPGRNEIGARENININPKHLANPLEEVIATLAHEAAHAWQHNYGTPGKNRYHNKALREKLAGMGIPCDRYGHSEGIAEPFVSFLREHGVTAEERLVDPDSVPSRKSRSGTQPTKWTCGCTKVWATNEVHAVCTQCGNQFFRA